MKKIRKYTLSIVIILVASYAYSETFNTETLQNFWKNTYSANLINNIEKTDSGIETELLVKANPDECYKGVGKSTPIDELLCTNGIPRVNESYPWSMAISEKNLWFSTFTNLVCGVLSTRGIYIPILNNIPNNNGVKICEMGLDNYVSPIGTSRQNWRPPHIYRYDIENNNLIEVTPNDNIIYRTLGIRSAIVYNNMVFFLGLPQKPRMNTNKNNESNEYGLIMYAYDDATGEYLGYHVFKEYGSSRKWVKTPYGLYVIVNGTENNKSESYVLRWIGNKTNPFKFKIVGNIQGNATNMAYYNNRLFVNTWPSMKGLKMMGMVIFMSPELTTEGLTELSGNQWKKVWNIEDYEPDNASAATYAGGAMESYNGYLYWGTMNIPFTGIGGHILKYGILPSDTIIAFLASFRPISIFRGKDFGTPEQKVEVLYGLEKMPVYEPPLSKGNTLPIGKWVFKENKVGKPLYGTAGFGNPFNSYTWSMTVYDNKLFIGTMDYSYSIAVQINKAIRNLLKLVVANVPSLYDINTEYLPFKDSFDYGADLYYFKDNNSPAIAVTKNGFNNYSNFGIRTMASNNSGLYIGVANPFNLLTNKNDNAPEGGFEIRRLTTLSED